MEKLLPEISQKDKPTKRFLDREHEITSVEKIVHKLIDSVSELVENYESWNCEERFQRCGKHWNGTRSGQAHDKKLPKNEFDWMNQHGEMRLSDGVLKWISRGEQFSTDAAEDSVGKPKVREDEEVKNAGGEIIKDILKKI
ncbi:hypothetical protein YC2023_118736 [Brassica napus]